jgi:hypothetical protein
LGIDLSAILKINEKLPQLAYGPHRLSILPDNGGQGINSRSVVYQKMFHVEQYVANEIVALLLYLMGE